MQLVVNQTDTEVRDYKIDEQHVRFDCKDCGVKKFMKIKDIENYTAQCKMCDRD